MSRELVIMHDATMLWSCTTSFPLGASWYAAINEDEGTITLPLLTRVAADLARAHKTTQQHLARLNRKLELPTLDSDTFDAIWEEQSNVEELLAAIDSGMRLVELLQDIVDTIAVTQGTPLTYIKSY